jgi:type IV pilus assembly protein PilA
VLNSHRKVAEAFIAADCGHKLQPAFELGAVAVVFLLLVSLAVGSFETYIVRGQLSEAFILTSTVKSELVAYRAEYGYWPRDAAALANPTLSQLNDLGTFSDHLALGDQGSLTTFFSVATAVASLKGRQLTQRPMLVSESPGSPVIWVCAAHGAPAGFASGGADRTDIEVRYLPAKCRNY